MLVVVFISDFKQWWYYFTVDSDFQNPAGQGNSRCVGKVKLVEVASFVIKLYVTGKIFTLIINY